jgi:predicted ATPase/DNA-binding CsgD family transcriptional regulator/Tfp pilus assembly protein PilF
MHSSFIGRNDELTALDQLITGQRNRLITVTGPGGVGKTRLVTEVVRRLDGSFPSGVWVVPLAHLRQPELVLASIATHLGIRDIDAGETLDRVAERLGNQPTLLVLDNLEQVIDCGPTIVQLLQRAPALVILATSRQPLQLHGEIEYPLRPLQTESDSLDETPAEQLFLVRAREASYGFEATTENRAAIRQISQRLGGIPLAIELAASWVKMLPPHRLRENLDRQLDVLVRGPRDLPERQQTMRSAIAWSYHLLTSDEQALFRQLGVFQGGFTLADIQAVSAGPDSNEWPELDVLDGLSSLVTKSLVQASDEPVDPRQPEYTVLETIRAFAVEQLVDVGEVTAARYRHLAHFTRLAEHWTVDLGSAKRDRRLSQLDRVYPNFRAALEWALESGQTAAGLRLISALWVYWDWRGLHAEGARWCDRMLALDTPVELEIRSSALYAGAAIAFMQAKYPRSVELAEECLAVAERSGDDRSIGRALIALGNSAYDQGNLDRAEAVYTRSLETIRRIDEPTALQVALVNLGYVRYQQERFAEARALFEEAIAEDAHTGHGAGYVWAMVGRAQTDVREGRERQAEESLQWLIDRQREADSGQLGAALAVLAALRRAQGRYADAAALARESLANRVARDERAFITDSLAEVGAIALAAGALETGIVLSSAVAAQRGRLGYGLPDLERAQHRELLDRAKSTMPSTVFEAAWSRGERMTMAEALAFAAGASLAEPHSLFESTVSATELAILTKREREVLRLIVDGKTDREIAQTLSISSGTASRHVANILHKLDVRTRSAAAAWAIRNGLT